MNIDSGSAGVDTRLAGEDTGLIGEGTVEDTGPKGEEKKWMKTQNKYV